MTTLTEYIPNVISYLLAATAAQTILPSPPLVIIDGQPATQDVLVTNPAGLTQRLWIGSDGYVTSGDMAEAASSQQGFTFLDNARTRDDQIDIAMAGEAVSGDMTMATARNGAFAVMAMVETLLRGSPGTIPASPGDATMGALVAWSEVVGPIELTEGQKTGGSVALVKFRVSAFLRLTS